MDSVFLRRSGSVLAVPPWKIDTPGTSSNLVVPTWVYTFDGVPP